jgi:hypothetical protein
MVEILEIPIHADKNRIKRKIRSKVDGCGFPNHWIIREPLKSNEKLWLRPRDLDTQRGKQVQVRRVLYYIEYGGLPLKEITIICGEKRCVNPAHMRVSGFEKECNVHIEDQIEKGWLYPDDAEQWFGWDNKHGVQMPAPTAKFDAF